MLKRRREPTRPISDPLLKKPKGTPPALQVNSPYLVAPQVTGRPLGFQLEDQPLGFDAASQEILNFSQQKNAMSPIVVTEMGTKIVLRS